MLDRFQFRKRLPFFETRPRGVSNISSRSIDLRSLGDYMSLRLFTPRSNPSPLPRTGYRNRLGLFLAATALSTFTGGAAFAVDGDANDTLLKKMEKMERPIQSLEAELKQKQVAKLDDPAKPTRPSALQPNAKDTNKDPGKEGDKDDNKAGNNDSRNHPNHAVP